MYVALVVRGVNSSRQYHVGTDKMVCSNQENGLCADHLFEKNDTKMYHSNLLKLYIHIFFV